MLNAKKQKGSAKNMPSKIPRRIVQSPNTRVAKLNDINEINSESSTSSSSSKDAISTSSKAANATENNKASAGKDSKIAVLKRKWRFAKRRGKKKSVTHSLNWDLTELCDLHFQNLCELQRVTEKVITDARQGPLNLNKKKIKLVEKCCEK